MLYYSYSNLFVNQDIALYSFEDNKESKKYNKIDATVPFKPRLLLQSHFLFCNKIYNIIFTAWNSGKSPCVLWFPAVQYCLFTNNKSTISTASGLDLTFAVVSWATISGKTLTRSLNDGFWAVYNGLRFLKDFQCCVSLIAFASFPYLC